MKIAARGDHVFARGEDAAQFIHIGARTHVKHSISIERDQIIGGIGRLDAGFHPGPRKRACILANFVRIRNPQADQVQIRMLDHHAQRTAADIAGRPLDHAVFGGLGHNYFIFRGN